jgi:O-antigen ligase
MTGPFHFIRSLTLALVGLTLPFDRTVLFSIGFIPVTPNKVMAAMLLAVVGLQWAQSREPGPRDPKRPWILFLGVSLAISGVQALAAFDWRPTYVLGLLFTWYTIFLFYLMLVYTLRDRRDLDRLLFFFVVGSVIVTLSGWAGWGEARESYRLDRLGGEGGNPNVLGFNLLLAIAITASLLFTARSMWKQVVYLGLMAIMLAGVLATLSRAAYVSLPFMFLLWAVRFRKGTEVLKYAIPGVSVALVAALLAPELVVDRLLTLSPDGIQADESARDRFAMVPAIFRAFLSNPITGIGVGSYVPWASEHGEIVHGIHNAYLTLLAENGLLGFVPYMVILAVSWREYNRARLQVRWPDPALNVLRLRATCLQIGMFGILINSLGHPTYQAKGLWMLLAMSTVLPGMVAARVRELGSEQTPAPEGGLPTWHWDPLPSGPRGAPGSEGSGPLAEPR